MFPVTSQDKAPNWRVSLRRGDDKSLQRSIQAAQIYQKREEDVEEANARSVEAKFRGVSIKWLNQFHNQLLNKEISPQIQLKILKKQKKLTLRNGSTVTLEEGQTLKGVKEGRNVHYKIPFILGEVFQMAENELEEKSRDQWTMQDIWDFVLRPKLNELDFAESYIENIFPKGSPEVGEEFQGSYLIYPRHSTFSEVLQALTSFSERMDRGMVPEPEFNYVWIDIFCSNLMDRQSVELEQTSEEEVKKLEKNEVNYLMDVHVALSKFNQRLVFFDDWPNPKILKRLWCLWELFGACKLPKDNSLEIITVRDNDFDVATCDCLEGIFYIIENLDPSNLVGRNELNNQNISNVLRTLEGGFAVVISALKKQLSHWFSNKLEELVKTFPNRKHDESLFGTLLLASGEFMRKRGHFEVSKNYIEKALNSFDGLKRKIKPNSGDAKEEAFRAKLELKMLECYVQLGYTSSRLDAKGLASNWLSKADEMLQAVPANEKDKYIEMVYLAQAILATERGGKTGIQDAITHYEFLAKYFKGDGLTRDTKRAKFLYLKGKLLLEDQQISLAREDFFDSATLHKSWSSIGTRDESYLKAKFYEGVCYFNLRKYLEALQIFVEIFTLRCEVSGKCNLDTGKACFYKGQCQSNLKKYDMALLTYEDAVSIYESSVGKWYFQIADIRNSVAMLYTLMPGTEEKKRENIEKAIDEYNKAIDIARKDVADLQERKREVRDIRQIERKIKEKETRLAVFLVNCGDAYELIDYGQNALEVFEDAKEIRKRVFGEQHERYIRVADRLKKYYN